MSVVARAAEVIAWKWHDMDLGYISSGRAAALIKALADANLLRPEWATDEAERLLDVVRRIIIGPDLDELHAAMRAYQKSIRR